MGMSRVHSATMKNAVWSRPKKAENGYRYYTEADISRLIGILYQRKWISDWMI